MTAELEIKDFKAQLPYDFKYLNSVKINGEKIGEDMYMQHFGELFFWVIAPTKEIDKCEVDYIPYDTERINKAIFWMKETYLGFPEYVYHKAARYTNADEWYGNRENSQQNILDGFPKQYHTLFLEYARRFFERTARQLGYIK